MSAQDLAKKLKIKLGSCKRIHKEMESYIKEAEQQEAKIATMKSQNEDSYRIKKQTEVLDETKNMIPDTKRRLETAHSDLNEMLQTIEASKITSVIDSEDFKTAQTLIIQLDPLFDN
eukprot:TRINITY_DN5341_c0_g1_i1.p1 TRINITY_DN5341_c0_g1~~TRINITY_DN5341_c0_g1_i1.p1  ORF type:complete len:117 (+),score=33.63 TRINITY_DN5341_c0_g1_i1:79-429(+)